MWRRRSLLIAPTVLDGMALMLLAPIRCERQWIDTVSGSMRHQTQWLFLRTEPTVKRSALEKWIVQREGRHRPRWRFLSGTWETITGRPAVFDCGLAPPMHQMRPALSVYVATASDDDISEFVRIMRTGRESEQQIAIRNAVEAIVGVPAECR